jgi:class 3 adenylate cyclase
VEADSPLITTLQNRSSPLAADRFSRRDRIEQLSLFDRAALDTLGAAVVVPARVRSQLAAFICLGPKRSGDIYTSTDLALLTAVADKVSTQLDHMDQEQITREAREMQEELRRFVPGVVAQQVEAGADLEPRERPVSVLFVDIRGYATYTESRRAHEVFTTVNRYTQAVSAIVDKFGGSVVEFNGDGMMAVFGAPQALPDKERAAVLAGREIVTKVQGLGGTDVSGTISVGVGVATGSAFVGSIQAVDRMIWRALGNTTNLAARLQGLTRDLDAAMVIDLATWRAAGEPREFERREQVAIRGRSQREDLYVLPPGGGGKS